MMSIQRSSVKPWDGTDKLSDQSDYSPASPVASVSVTGPVSESVTESVSKSVTEPVTESVTESAPERERAAARAQLMPSMAEETMPPE